MDLNRLLIFGAKSEVQRGFFNDLQTENGLQEAEIRQNETGRKIGHQANY